MAKPITIAIASCLLGLGLIGGGCHHPDEARRLDPIDIDPPKAAAPTAAAAPAPAPAPTKAKPPAGKRPRAPVRQLGKHLPRPATRPAPVTGAAPGSGEPLRLPEADKRELAEAYIHFFTAADKEDVATMKKFTTERLGNALANALDKHRERFMRSIKKYAAQVPSGVKVGSVGKVYGGNIDVELLFGEGEPDHVMFFKERGKWRINRL